MNELERLLSIPMTSLLKEEYGKLSLKSEESKILFIRKILEYLIRIDPNIIITKMNTFNNFIANVKQLFNTLENYSGQNKEQFISIINSFVIPAEIYAMIALDLSLNNNKKMNEMMNSKLEEVTLTIEKINKQEEERTDKLKKQEQESEYILKKMKENMATTGIADYAEIFQKESNIHKKDSENWFVGIISIVGVIIIVALLLLVGGLAPKNNETATLVQFTFSKIIIFSSLFFLLTLAFKSYKASKHNEILNKHRQNAITTFEKFVKSANDDKTKNAVLLQTVNAIFSQQSTGYNDNDNDSGTPQTKFLEIINSSVKSDSK